MKKIIAILLIFCVVCSIHAMAEGPNGEMPQGTPGGQRPQGEMPQGTPGGQRPQGEMPQGNPWGQRPQGEMPGNRGDMQPPGGETPVIPQGDATEVEESVDSQKTQPSGETVTGNNPWNGFMPQGNQNFMGGAENTQEESQPTGVVGFLKTYSTSVVSVVLLLAAFIFVKFYKRKQY